MPKRSRKPPSDPNLAARSILDQVTGESEKVQPLEKNAAAVELGRRGGLRGGPARAKKLTAVQRKASAKKAAIARWGKKR